MKWLFIILLLCNVFYYGWELDRQTRIAIKNSSAAISIPAGTERLKLLPELETPPEVRVSRSDQPETGPSPQDEIPGQTDETPQVITESPPSGVNGIAEIDLDTKSDILLAFPDISKNTLNRATDNGDTLCFTYGPLPDGEETDRLEDWFRSRHFQVKHRQTDEKGRQLFWIYLAPLDTRANAVAAIEDLKKKGIEDMRLIVRGDMLNAISLGLYSTQATVNRRLREIKSKGYKPIVVPHYGGKKIHWLDVRIDEKTPALNEIIEGLPARYNSVPVRCNEIAMTTVNP